MKRVIKASSELLVNKAIADYLSGRKTEGSTISTSVKYLINRYNQQIILDTTSESQIVRQAGEGLLEYLLDHNVDPSMFESSLEYFVRLNHNSVAASTSVASSDELPDGYLTTSKFSCPSIKTDDQRNALQALEIAITQKFKQFNAFCTRQFMLTSASSWTGEIYVTEDSCYYIQLRGTRTDFAAFVCGDSVVRKPSNAVFVGNYSVSGDEGRVDWMSRFRAAHPHI